MTHNLIVSPTQTPDNIALLFCLPIFDIID